MLLKIGAILVCGFAARVACPEGLAVHHTAIYTFMMAVGPLGPFANLS